MANMCDSTPPAGCSPSGVTDPRVLDCFARRFNTATNQSKVVSGGHTSNGDEALYPDKCATYTKCIKQASPGKVDLPSYHAFRDAINQGELDPTGAFNAFQSLTLGGSRPLNGPMGAFAYSFCGADSSQFGDTTVAQPPALATKAYATELIELYWCSLLRDVAFSEYATNTLAQEAANELSTSADYAGPTDSSGAVTPALLFRGTFQGETIGPYVSQFFLTPTVFGAQPIDQKYITYLPGFDYMTDIADWFAVQQGKPTSPVNQVDPTHRYLHNGRGLAAFTHVDELYEAYFIAHLVLEAMNASKPVLNPGNPYTLSKTQNGFGTLGFPDIAAVLGQVAKTALDAVWYQKWVVHLRHRPEAGAGMVHLIDAGVTFDGSPDGSVFSSTALLRSLERYGTRLLSQAFPEGSPAHPAYPTGHGSVGGACITILKFFYNGDVVLTNPQVATSDGTALEPWDYDPATGAPGILTINGELNKLARNVTFGHGLHGGIHWRSDSDSSLILGEAVALNFLRDLACTYAEPFSITITKLDGTPATITNM